MRAGTVRSQFNEHSEAMFLTSSFVFGSAAEAAARFKGEQPGPIYARFTNPTVSMMEERLAALEGAERCVAFASGMAAILATVMGLMKAGEHVVASRSIFGSTVQLFSNILGRFGIETTYVSPTDPAEWRAAVKPNTKLFFVESPSNPLTEVSDIRALADDCPRSGCMARGRQLLLLAGAATAAGTGADIVIHSATKYLDGQGRVLGGAVLGSQALMEGVYTFLRTAGPTLSAFNAWVILKGLETLSMRMDAHSKNALALAQWLEAQPQVCARVVSRPAVASATCDWRWRSRKPAAASSRSSSRAARTAAWKLIDATRMLSITANLGDTKTTITHPATTTHSRMTPEQRAAAGISDGLVRIAVGLESVADIQADLARGLA